VGDEAVELDEAPLVEQPLEPLPGGELALPVLRGNAGRAAPCFGGGPASVQVLEAIPGGAQGVSPR